MITKGQADELRAFIAVAEACWKGSPSWHVLDWMSYRMRLRYPLVRNCDHNHQTRRHEHIAALCVSNCEAKSMTTNPRPWRLFRRPARWKRRAAERGSQYDGARWKLKGRYETREQAEGVVSLMKAKWLTPSIPIEQFKIMHDNEGRP